MHDINAQRRSKSYPIPRRKWRARCENAAATTYATPPGSIVAQEFTIRRHHVPRYRYAARWCAGTHPQYAPGDLSASNEKTRVFAIHRLHRKHDAALD